MSAIDKYSWWQKGVIYQIYPRSFADSDGDGVGDIPGIIQHLDYLSDVLGIDAIWLSPFYPSPMADFGYDVADYTDIDPVFGTLDDFDQLVESCHQRGVKLIIDFVPNHSSDQHPWFIESSSSRDNPRRDWYTWRDAKQDGSPPNNWLSVFGGSAWEWHAPTGQYYLHSFLKEQPDLNWRNPGVKAAMLDAVRFWLERHVDGLRIDVAHFVMKDPQLRDNPLKKNAKSELHKSLGAYDTQIHQYDQDHADIHPLYREFRQLLDAYSQERSRFAIGEIHIFDWERWSKYYGQALDELHMPFNFQLLGIDLQVKKVQRVIEAVEQALPQGAWPNYVLGNHDEMRIASRYNELQARLAAMLLLTLRGTPTIYYGDEIGMQQVLIPADQQQDPWGIRVPGLGRDGCRTPMQWNDQRHAGFSPPDASKTWLPVAEDYQERNVAKQLEQANSMLNLSRRLLAVRKSSPALQVGDFTRIENLHADCFAYQRSLDDHPENLILMNFADQELMVNTGFSGNFSLLVSTYMDRVGKVDLSQLSLRKYEGVIIERKPNNSNAFS